MIASSAFTRFAIGAKGCVKRQVSGLTVDTLDNVQSVKCRVSSANPVSFVQSALEWLPMFPGSLSFYASEAFRNQ
jgi:hypothetical protein